MKKLVTIAIVLAAVAIPAAFYFAGPLFTNTTIDEAAPPVSGETLMNKGGDAMVEKSELPSMKITGRFVGVGDGIHDANGRAAVIPVADGSVLRLEEFRSTNGPDLYVYLATDEQASDFLNLGRLKANIGNQNYEIPRDTDLAKYDTVLIWCQQFSVLFGSAQLTSS
jgi:hypothetical protein